MEGRTAATSRGGLQGAIKSAIFVHPICNVAQDLERQVRLRLGLYQTSVENKTEGDDVGAALSRYDQLSKHLQYDDDQRANKCEFPNHTEQVPDGVGDEVKKDREFQGKREERKDAVLLKHREKRCKANGLGEKAQLFLHLNKLGPQRYMIGK